MQIKRARREKQKAIIGFIGPSGSGKTVGALLTAYGIVSEMFSELSPEEVWEKIGVIDTEHSRSQLYVNETFGDVKVGEFLHLDLEPPYSTDRYQQALELMVKEGVEVIVIDSLSHNWQGEGGIVDTHANMTGNSFQNWGKLAGETNNLVKTLTRNNIHILCTLRTKTEYVVEPNEQGKAAPRKVGTKPMQKDEMEYEFMINFMFSADHVATTTKDNTRLFEDRPQLINEGVGRSLYKWLELGIDVKGEERKYQQDLIASIRELEKLSEAHKEKVVEFEYKTKSTVEQFNVPLLERAKQLLETIEVAAAEN